MLLRGDMMKRAEKWPVIGWWWHHPVTTIGRVSRSLGLLTDKTKKKNKINRRQSKKPPSLWLRGLIITEFQLNNLIFLCKQWRKDLTILKCQYCGVNSCLLPSTQFKCANKHFLSPLVSVWTEMKSSWT